MFKVKVFFPELMEEAKEFECHTLKEIAEKTGFPYYFIYNAFYKKHKNQLHKYFSILSSKNLPRKYITKKITSQKKVTFKDVEINKDEKKIEENRNNKRMNNIFPNFSNSNRRKLQLLCPS